MRTGVTREAVYVAPRRRGVKGRDRSRRRPRFADILLERAMQPALQRNIPGITKTYKDLLGKALRKFSS